MPRLVLVGVLLALVAAPAARAQGVTLDATDQPVTSLTDALSRASGRTIVAVDGELDDRVSLTVFDLPWRDALDVLALASGRRVRPLGEALLLEAPRRVTIQFTDARGRAVLQLLGAYAGHGVAVRDDVSLEVTLDLKEVPHDDALAALATSWPDLHLTWVGEQLVVTGAPLELDVRALLPERAWPRGGSAQGRVTVEGARALDDVCRRLSAAAGLAVEADPGLRLERPLTLRDAPWRDALRVVAAVAGARVETRAGRARLVAPPSTHLHVTRAALGDVIELLGAAFDAPLTTDDPLRAVSCRLERFALDEAAIAVAVVAGCEPVRTERGWHLAARALPATRVVAVEPTPYVPEEEHRPPPSDRELTAAQLHDLWGGPPPTVEGTLLFPGGAVALIDGRVHRVGDPLAGASGAPRATVRVVGITGSLVRFEGRAGQTLAREVSW